MTKVASKRLGLSEGIWRDLTSDQQIKWKLWLFILFALGAWIVSTTGFKAIDWGLKVVTGLMTLFVLESQRYSSKLGRRFRRVLLCASVNLGASLVGAFFLVMVIGVYAELSKVWVSVIFDASQLLGPFVHQNPYVTVSLFLIVLFQLGRTIFEQIKRLGFTTLVFSAPKQYLIDLFIRRRWPMNHKLLFAYFEISVVVTSIIYMHLCSQAILLLMQILK